jgi:predicted metal-binding transcription factor (methanogenesis marker protein 9)
MTLTLTFGCPVTKLCRQHEEVKQNHENATVRNIGQGETQYKKHKRLKLGGGQACDRSSVWTAVVA